ncbi:hypothetical protein JCM1840_002408 [Sporobolomyces johnsonii]
MLPVPPCTVCLIVNTLNAVLAAITTPIPVFLLPFAAALFASLGWVMKAFSSPSSPSAKVSPASPSTSSCKCTLHPTQGSGSVVPSSHRRKSSKASIPSTNSIVVLKYVYVPVTVVKEVVKKVFVPIPAPEPVTVTKEVIKEVVVIGPTPEPITIVKEVIKEVVKEIVKEITVYVDVPRPEVSHVAVQVLPEPESVVVASPPVPPAMVDFAGQTDPEEGLLEVGTRALADSKDAEMPPVEVEQEEMGTSTDMPCTRDMGVSTDAAVLQPILVSTEIQTEAPVDPSIFLRSVGSPLINSFGISAACIPTTPPLTPPSSPSSTSSQPSLPSGPLSSSSSSQSPDEQPPTPLRRLWSDYTANDDEDFFAKPMKEDWDKNEDDDEPCASPVSSELAVKQSTPPRRQPTLPSPSIPAPCSHAQPLASEAHTTAPSEAHTSAPAPHSSCRSPASGNTKRVYIQRDSKASLHRLHPSFIFTSRHPTTSDNPARVIGASSLPPPTLPMSSDMPEKLAARSKTAAETQNAAKAPSSTPSFVLPSQSRWPARL